MQRTPRAAACEGTRFASRPPENYVNTCTWCILSKQASLLSCSPPLSPWRERERERAKLAYLNSDHLQTGFFGWGHSLGHNPDEMGLSGPQLRYHTLALERWHRLALMNTQICRPHARTGGPRTPTQASHTHTHTHDSRPPAECLIV